MRKLASIFTALLLLLAPGIASAGVSSNTVTVPMNFSVPESISLSLSTNSVTLTSAAQSADVILTLGYQVQGGHTSATVFSWFSQTPVAGAVTISSGQFSTAYNHGAQVTCNQPAFTGFSGGVPNQDCGTFSLPGISTTLVASTSVTLTLAAAPSTFQGIVGNYQGGILNIEFVIL